MAEMEINDGLDGLSAALRYFAGDSKTLTIATKDFWIIVAKDQDLAAKLGVVEVQEADVDAVAAFILEQFGSRPVRGHALEMDFPSRRGFTMTSMGEQAVRVESVTLLSVQLWPSEPENH